MNKRVGILTWHYNNNFGSTLQAFALQESLKNIGYDPFFLNYRNQENPREKYKNLARVLRSYYLEFAKNDRAEELRYNFLRFRNKYFKQGNYAYNKKSLKRQCKKCCAVICGSDQIWAPNVFNPVYMLDFVPSSKKKISYAASIGLNDLPKKYIEKYSRLLSDFDAVSVRERAGAELLEKKCGIIAETVLDPTLLINVDEWAQLERAITHITGKYIFCYFLNAEHHYSNLVKNYAMKKGYKVIGVSTNKNDNEWMKLVNIGPSEFLWLVHNATAVFTDSYHGTIFSLLYHKPLVIFERFNNDDPICQNSRIYQLDNYFGLDGVILDASSIDEISIKELDYNNLDEILKKLRINSLDFLIKALEK